MASKEPVALDLKIFSTRDEWLSYARGKLPKAYTELAAKHVVRGGRMTTAHMLFQSFISRGRGLHEGSLREITANNPHGVFPLNRAFAELVSLLIYCVKEPYYIDVLTGIGPNHKRAKKSFQAIFHAIRIEARGMKEVYKHLSEYSHFGEVAVYNVHVPKEGGSTLQTSWTDTPRWRSEEDFRVACSQLAELHAAFIGSLGEFADRYLGENPTAHEVGWFT